ncbi:MAG: hypothetical protein COU42_02110 [Candidatus Nealsonbacteria bacterium CG10_big_fil_rev_8_21_14_0_10_36_24]|uniref:Uncharacterized protein n=2 Tax=Candidatus Nealsoniibacteriota TaxID=1817911 RepID=A0A2M6NRR7_9BACT|nr:MAG: hypothetical protein COU42_02110 [Candidatus Nealsonbacteria bacterium CG10_big_fil_rev_8_21_14_0_10_36_24]
MKRGFFKKVFSVATISFLLFLWLSVFLFFPNLIVKAQGMTSTNYKIISSDINAGGRDDQTSTTYKMQDTIGGIATGISESALYKLMAGYRTLDDLSISFSISDLAIGFGDFSSTDVRWTTSNEAGATSQPANQNPTYITIATNAPNGAIVSARSQGDGTGIEGNGSAGIYKSSSPTKLIAATACTTVTNGTESYALYVKNIGSNLTADSGFNGGTCSGIISTIGQTILTASVPLSTNNTADIALKAAIASTTAAGSYADVIILTATGRF